MSCTVFGWSDVVCVCTVASSSDVVCVGAIIVVDACTGSVVCNGTMSGTCVCIGSTFTVVIVCTGSIVDDAVTDCTGTDGIGTVVCNGTMSGNCVCIGSTFTVVIVCTGSVIAFIGSLSAVIGAIVGTSLFVTFCASNLVPVSVFNAPLIIFSSLIFVVLFTGVFATVFGAGASVMFTILFSSVCCISKFIFVDSLDISFLVCLV